MLTAASGRMAGPFTTDPLTALYLLPWHGQWIVPLDSSLTMQPSCVQIAVNAWKVPAFGWVITIFWVLRTLPPPTGMSSVLARTADVLAPAADAAPGDDAAPVAGEAAPPGAGGPARPSLVP